MNSDNSAMSDSARSQNVLSGTVGECAVDQDNLCFACLIFNQNAVAVTGDLDLTRSQSPRLSHCFMTRWVTKKTIGNESASPADLDPAWKLTRWLV